MQFDCTRCEELLLDYAYGELDEVTAAAFRRHADSCARCGASLADVRVVREAFSMLPLETPSPTVDNRILAAADLRLNELDDKKRTLQREDSRSLLGKLFDYINETGTMAGVVRRCAALQAASLRRMAVSRSMATRPRSVRPRQAAVMATMKSVTTRWCSRVA